MRSRRRFLAGGTALLSAGCLSFDSWDRDPNTFCRYEFRARPFDPAAELPPAYSPAQRALANRAIRTNESTAVYGPRPLKNDSFVVLDGTYYRVTHLETRSAEVPALVMDIDWRKGQTPPSNAAVYPVDALPRVDRRAFRSAVFGGLYREHVPPEQVFVFSDSPVLYPAGIRDSELAACDSCWVRMDGRAFAVSVSGNTTTTTLVHSYTAMEEAPNATAFRRLVAARYLVNLDDLPPAQRTILEEAIDGGYVRRTDDARIPEAERLVRRLRTETETVPESGGTWYVEYDGKRYGLEIGGVCQGL